MLQDFPELLQCPLCIDSYLNGHVEVTVWSLGWHVSCRPAGFTTCKILDWYQSTQLCGTELLLPALT